MNKQITLKIDTKPTLDALIKVINRAAQAMMQTQNREKRRNDTELRALTSIKKKVASAAPGSPISLNRPEVRLIQALLVTTSSTLYTTIIPNYKERIEREPENKDKYQPYIDQCETRILEYKKVLDLINDIL